MALALKKSIAGHVLNFNRSYKYITGMEPGPCMQGRADKLAEKLEIISDLGQDLIELDESHRANVERERNELERCVDQALKDSAKVPVPLPVAATSGGREINHLSLNKLGCGQSVKFAGYIVSSEGVRPDPAKLEAIRSFPVPKSVTDLRSFLGLANQLGAFLPDLAHSTVLMRDLLKKENAFVWLAQHDEEFKRTRGLLCSAELVKPFDPKLSTELLTDASRLHGLCYALIQREPTGRPRLIQCGSCSLSPAMKNYATIELEATAVLWASLKCDFYLRGMRHFTVVTDHKPLLGIFEKPMASMGNDRLQRIRERLIIYTFSVKWSSGKEHSVADALSRAPFFPADPSVEVPLRSINVDDPALQMIYSAIDPEYCSLRTVIQEGITKKLPPMLSSYQGLLASLRTDGGLIMSGDRLVVPRAARSRVIDLLHLSHSGIVKTTEQARQLYVWPGISNEIKNRIATCDVCIATLPSQQSEPVLSSAQTVTQPMDGVSVDLFDLEGVTFIVMIDRFSGFPFVARLSSTTTKAICDVLLRWFGDVGMPIRIKTDNGPQFRGPFADFCASFNILHETSSPYHPRSNGLAESAVKAVKGLLKKLGSSISSPEFQESLLMWRVTPRADGFSPAFGFYGRQLRTRLPVVSKCQANLQDFNTARLSKDFKNVKNAGGRLLSTLEIGQPVTFQNPITKRWQVGGVIQEKCTNNRSYLVATASGVIRRNRRFLRPTALLHREMADPNIPDTGVFQPIIPRRSTRKTKKHVAFQS